MTKSLDAISHLDGTPDQIPDEFKLPFKNAALDSRKKQFAVDDGLENYLSKRHLNSYNFTAIPFGNRRVDKSFWKGVLGETFFQKSSPHIFSSSKLFYPTGDISSLGEMRRRAMEPSS
jgi:hypothetical protein